MYVVCLNEFKKYYDILLFASHSVLVATKETAFIHAMSTAAIIHEITIQCRMGKIPGCGCAVKKQRNGNGDWQWGGCGDNIRFGEKETRRFINILENGHNARTAFNLHNNEIGRQVTWRNSIRITEKYCFHVSCAPPFWIYYVLYRYCSKVEDREDIYCEKIGKLFMVTKSKFKRDILFQFLLLFNGKCWKFTYPICLLNPFDWNGLNQKDYSFFHNRLFD